MPKQNKLHNQLKSLFDDLDQEAGQLSAAHAMPAAWHWVCDQKGHYIECGPEVFAVLGIAPEAFIGKAVAGFALAPDAISRVENALLGAEFPVEVQVDFLTASGQAVAARLSIISGPTSALPQWQGVVQPLLPAQTARLSPPVSPVEKRTARRSVTDKLFLPESEPLTPTGQESLSQFRPIFDAGLDRGTATMAVPFRLQDEHVGLVEVLDEDRSWSPDEQNLVMQVADQLSLALENARLFQETQAALNETATLYAITSAASRSLEIESTLQEMLGRVLEAIGMNIGLIATYDPDLGSLRLVVQQNLPEALLQIFQQARGLENSLCSVVYHQRGPLGIPDLETTTTTVNVSGLIQNGIRSYLGVPLVSKGQVLGTLCAMRGSPYPKPANSLDLMEVAGQQIGIAIENANLFRETQSRAEELSILNEMGRALSSQLNMTDVLAKTYEYTARLFDVENFFIAIYDPAEEQELSFPLAISENQRVAWRPRKLGNGLSEHVLFTRQPLLIKDDLEATVIKLLGRELIGQKAESWLGVPLLIGGQAIGVIAVQSYTTPRKYNERHRDLLVAVASQAAIAIQNARLYQEEQRRRQIADSLREIARVVGSTLDLNLVIERMLDQIERLIPFTSASIQLVESGRRRVIGGRGYDRGNAESDGPRLWRPIAEDPLIAEVVRTRQPLVLSDTAEDPRWEALPSTQDIRSWIAAPMVAGQDVVGIMTLDQVMPRAYSQESGELAMAVAAQAAVAIQNAGLFNETQRRAEETTALNDLARALSTRLDISRVLEEVHRGVSRLLDTTNFYIALYDADTDENVFVVNVTESQLDQSVARLPAGQGITGYILRTQESVLIGQGVENWLKEHQIPTVGEPAVSWLGVPMIVGGQAIGVMAVQSYNELNVYDEHDLALLTAISSQASIAIQNARLFEQNQAALAETDALYRAGAELSTALRFDDVLAILRKHTIAGAGSNLVAAILFEHPWGDQDQPAWIEVISRWTTLDAAILANRYALDRFPAFATLAQLVQHSGEPLLFEDVTTDEKLDPPSRQLYREGFGASSAMILPMIAGGQLIGCFNITYSSPTVFLEADVRRLAALTGQASVVVQNLRSIELAQQRAAEAQLRSEELALINTVVTAMVASDDLTHALSTVAETLHYEFELGHVGIALLNEEKSSLTIVAEKSSGREPTLGKAIPVQAHPATEEVLRTRRPLIINDPQNDARLAASREAMLQQRVIQVAMFPIVTAGDVIGTIGMDVTQEGTPLNESDISLLTTLVGQISTAIQNSRLNAQTQQALAETANLYRANAELNAVKTYDAILDVLRKSTVLGHANISEVSLNIFDRAWTPDRSPEWMQALARWPADPYRELASFRVPLANWPTADQFMRSDEPVYIENATSDARLGPLAHAYYVNQLGAKGVLFAPLNVGGQWFGQIMAVFKTATPMTDKDLRLLGTLAGQASVAIQNIRLLEESRRRTAQLETAAEIARDTSGSLDLNILLRRVVNLMRDRYGYYHASIFLLDDSGLNAVVKESTGEAGEEMKRRGHKLGVGSQSVIGYVTQTGSPLIINDVSQNPMHRPNPLLPETKAELGLPLKIGYRVIGALDVQSSQVGAFNPDDVNVLQTLADQIAVAVDNARSYELVQMANAESRRRVQELSILYNISQSLASAPLESGEIATTIARQFIEIMDVPKCTIYALNARDELLSVIAEMSRSARDGLPGSEIVSSEDVGTTVSLHEHPAAMRVAHSLQPLAIQLSDPFADQVELAYMKAKEIETLVILPLAVKGAAVGIVMLESWGRARSFSADQLNLAVTLGNAAAVALDNARLYEEQRQAAEKLREVDKLKSQFLANMSHELRTPLNSIIGFSRVILKGIDGPVSELQQQDLSAINSAGQHLLNLINDILDISKIEAGKMELALEENVNLNDLLNSAMSYAIGLTKDKPIKLVKDFSAELPAVRADPTKLRQVIINFLSNASKFTEQGSITLRAKEQFGPDGFPEIKISVIDTGAGIAPEDQARLFQPFTQVDGSLTRKVGGTGLGLSISKRLIEMHDGRVELESAVGVGSTFSVILPLPYVKLPEYKPVEGEQVILAIDDDRQVINLYERYLNGQGYQVVALTDASKAVEKAIEVQPYAITLDIMMPNRNGWQILEALKADPRTHNIPVIVCSIVDNQEKGFSLGAADYLTKPVLQDDLINALNRLNGDGSIRDVLVIDDDADDLRLVQKILQDGDHYEVRTANGGPQGLAAIHERPPHAIILDLMMPELDGFTLLEAIRSDANLRDIPVIIFTAGDLSEEQKMHLAEMSQQMIYKNAFEEEDLLKSIERALERFKREDAA